MRENQFYIESESVTVGATCNRCCEELSRTRGSVAWECTNYECECRIIPMWEDARFVDDTGLQWTLSEEENEFWYPVYI